MKTVVSCIRKDQYNILEITHKNIKFDKNVIWELQIKETKK